MIPKIEIASLADGIPVIDEEAVGFYKLNCMACLENLQQKLKPSNNDYIWGKKVDNSRCFFVEA